MKNKIVIATIILTIFIVSAYIINIVINTNIEISEEGTTITDLSGRTNNFKTPAEKIILVRSRDIYELSMILGEETADKIVAWGPDIKKYDQDAYKKYLEKFPSLETKPLVGDIFKDALSAENILSYDPDVVIMDDFMIRRKYGSVDRLDAAGLPMIFFDQSNNMLESPQKGLEILGKLFNKKEKAQEMINYINEQIAIINNRLKNINDPLPTVYIEVGDKGSKEYGSTYGLNEGNIHTSWGAIAEYAKSKNIMDNVPGEMPVIDPEYLLKEDPDIIIITGANWEATADSMKLGYYANEEESKKLLKAFTDRPGWQSLKAVKNKQVYTIHHGMIMHNFSFVALQQLAKWFYPEIFKDIDPEKNLKEFHEKFMPIEYSGIWMFGLYE